MIYPLVKQIKTVLNLWCVRVERVFHLIQLIQLMLAKKMMIVPPLKSANEANASKPQHSSPFAHPVGTVPRQRCVKMVDVFQIHDSVPLSIMVEHVSTFNPPASTVSVSRSVPGNTLMATVPTVWSVIVELVPGLVPLHVEQVRFARTMNA